MNVSKVARIGTALVVGTLAANAQVGKFIPSYNSQLTPLVSLGTPPNLSQLSGSFAATLSASQLNVSVHADAKGAFTSFTPTISPTAPAELRFGNTLAGSTLVGTLPGTVTPTVETFFGVTVTQVTFSAPDKNFASNPGTYWVVVKGLYGAPGTAGTSTDLLAGSFQVAVVPEPETYAAAAALGLVGFGLWRRRNA